jgi:cytochrome d ubiquinol oxidase subunit II
VDLATVWFVLVAVLFVGFFILEGFDYGVGILLPFIGRDDTDRRIIINTIGPFWDGNEVWMITAGGAIFAAFPEWYATMFSGFYLALFLMLSALIVRGVAFEFRSKGRKPEWRNLWDWMIFIGSISPALLWGVAMANLIKGVPIDANMNYVGGLGDLISPYTLVGGLASFALFTLHGAIYLSLKTRDELMEKASATAWRLWPPAVILVFLFVIASYVTSDVFTQELGVNPGPVPLGAGAALLATGWFIRNRRDGWAFVMTALTVALATVTIFMDLYPRVMISSLNPAWSLTIDNASSSDYTLTVMTIVAVIFVPVVLIYQGWSYWVFRERIGRETHLEY